jgi:hypothetical protein
MQSEDLSDTALRPHKLFVVHWPSPTLVEMDEVGPTFVFLMHRLIAYLHWNALSV